MYNMVGCKVVFGKCHYGLIFSVCLKYLLQHGKWPYPAYSRGLRHFPAASNGCLPSEARKHAITAQRPEAVTEIERHYIILTLWDTSLWFNIIFIQ